MSGRMGFWLLALAGAVAWTAWCQISVSAGPGGTNEPSVSVPKPPTRPAKTIQHSAIGARVVASSTHKGNPDEGGPETLVDGSLGTRWSSEYSAPQRVEIHLPAELVLNKLRLHWENACATRYVVSVSADGQTWRRVYLYMNENAPAEARVDSVALKDTSASAIQLDLISVANTNWGFSLYEMELTALPK